VIRAEREDGLALVWIDRPSRRNALTLAMVEALRDELARAAAEPSVRGVIVAGVPPSTSAGVDLGELAAGTPASVRRLIDALADVCAAARRCPKPVAMAIQGHCFGGALELACACDLRVAAAGAMLGMPEVLLGIPSVIDAALIERHVGAGRATELMLTGEPIGAEQALDWGLVNRVVPEPALLDTCRELRGVRPKRQTDPWRPGTPSPGLASAVLAHALEGDRCAPRRRPRTWGTWTPNLSPAFPAGPLGQVTRHAPAAIGRQKKLFADWRNLPLDEAIERSKEELAASFSSGEPQRLAGERLRHRP
jgi:enoyl-CoA hydratase